MKNVRQKSLILDYSSNQTVNFLCASTFFRMVGFFVGGFRREIGFENNYSNSHASAIVVLGKGGVTQKNSIIFIKDKMSEAIEPSLISLIIEKLFEREIIDIYEKDTLNAISEIYQEFNLQKVEYCEKCYNQVPEVSENALCKYYLALARIRALLKKDSDNPYLWYVRGIIVHRLMKITMNETSQEMYNIPRLVDLLRGISRKYPNFLSLPFLIGKLEGTVLSLRHTAVEDYEKGYKKIIEYYGDAPDQLFLSHIYYRIGNGYEYFEKNRHNAYKYYNYSFSDDRKNYMALYKLARYEAEIRNNYEKAYSMYQQIEDILLSVYTEGYFQPVEYEYLFKIHFFSWNTEKRFSWPQISYQKIMKLKEEKEQDSRFFRSFFGEEGGKYYEFMHRRIRNFMK